MSEVTRSASVGSSAASPPPDRVTRPRRPPYLLLAICGLQAALSLTLVQSNTASAAEAEYLWVGRLVWRHWLHGAQLPPVAAHLSGSDLIYPPLGALADSLGGVTGARILSLLFMLGATVFLYLTAAWLIGRTGALFAAGLWAMTEPVIRLAFATYDPLAVMLTALSAWLIVQAGVRRHRGELVAAAALALALANVAAFSAVVIDPVVIAFAFLTWRGRMKTAKAAATAAWLAASFAVFLGLCMTATHSWLATATIYARISSDYQSALHVASSVWQYSGLVIVAAMLGVVTAVYSPRRQALLIVVGLASVLVPVVQVAAQTAWSLDQHLAYGCWFGAIAGGYAATTLMGRLPDARRWAAATSCAIALIYPAVNGWSSAWNAYHSWADARRFDSAFAPVAADSKGLLDVAGQQYIAEYYQPAGVDWQRWSTVGMSLNPRPLPPVDWLAYYDGQLAGAKYSAIVLFYAASSNSVAHQSEAKVMSGDRAAGSAELTGLRSLVAGQPGIKDLTIALTNDSAYRLAAVGPYDTSTLAGNHVYGVYAIWRKV